MKTIGKNIFSLGFSRIVSGLIIFFVYIKLVTYLGPDDFGRFSLVLAFYTVFLLFIDLGMSRHVIKKVSANKDRGGIYLGNFLILQFFVATLIFLVFLALPELLGYSQTVSEAMRLAGAGLFLAAIALPFSSILQAVQKIYLVALVYFIHSLINAGWMVFAILAGKGVVFIFWGYIIFGLVDLLLYFVFIKKITLPNFTFDKNLVKNIFILGLPFAFISAFEIGIQKIDIVIQKIYLPFAEVGLYSSAYRFLDFLTFLPAVVAISLFPYFSAKENLNDPDSVDTINHLNRYMWTLALPLGVFSTLLGKDIILTLFDERYIGAIVPFQILIWVASVTLIYAVPNVMMIVKQTRRTLYSLFVVILFNIVLNFWLVPIYGIVASAWITVASYILIAVFYIYSTKKQVQYRFLKYAPWPVFAVIISGGLLWYLRDMNFVLTGFLGVVIYFAILFSVKFLNKNDWLFLKSVFQKQ